MAGFVQSLGLQLVRCSGGAFDAGQLNANDVIAFYFSAHWCPPCRQFTPMLKKFAETLNSNGEGSLKIIFVSGDKSEHEMWKYIYEAHGDWLALAYSCRDGKERLERQYQVTGIPQLVVIDQVGRQAVRDARGELMAASSSSTQVLTTYLGWKTASGAGSGPPSQLSAPRATCGELPAGAKVRILGLVGAPEHNGCEGEIGGYDASKQRYVVKLAEKSLSLRASNLLQLLSVKVRGGDDPSAWSSATISDVDAATGELTMSREGDSAPCSGKLGDAEGPLLQKGAVVVVHGLQAESAKQYNDRNSTIVDFDEGAGRYLVQVSASAQLKIKPANLRIFPLC